MKLVYSEIAVADIVRLREFIAENDPLAAARVAAELLSRIENLCLFPEMGRAVDLAPSPKIIRDAIFGKYIIRYSAHTETVVILRIWHHLRISVNVTAHFANNVTGVFTRLRGV